MQGVARKSLLISVAVLNTAQIQSTVRDTNKTIVESETLTCIEEIRQRLSAVLQERPTKAITEFDDKSVGALNTLPVNTKIPAVLPFAIMMTADNR